MKSIRASLLALVVVASGALASAGKGIETTDPVIPCDEPGIGSTGRPNTLCFEKHSPRSQGSYSVA